MLQNEELDLYIVIFQTEVNKVYTKGNQVVVQGSPKRTGAQVITIKTKDIKPINLEESILVQLVTSEGDELDFSLTQYIPSDFWSKQKMSGN